ncbi:unnamed protein product [Colias eurytheme]|nr:unnamed protein product [Colias eurytheme]
MCIDEQGQFREQLTFFRPPRVQQRLSTAAGVDAVNAFATYFQSVFLKDKPQLSPNNICSHPDKDSSRVSISYISKSEIQNAVRRLKPRSSAGPDGIPPYLIKDCISVFLQPLHFLFNMSLSSDTYPNEWKKSRITPIPKSGCKSQINNYRPIAVASCFGKLLEIILNNNLTNQIRSLLCDPQHGFRSKRSTTTNLINFVDYTAKALDKKRQVDVAYFDFKKAFDRVNNDVLLSKFSKFGFTPKLIKYFANYFDGRVQYVQLGRLRSDPYSVHSGVSQGSTLGPTHFLVMVNDLPNVLRSAQCLMFADDLKLFLTIESYSDCLSLQNDIINLTSWCHENQLEFNISKCNIMTYTRSRSPIVYPYSLEGTTLRRVDHIRGILFDKTLTFNEHIEAVCQKAYKSLGFIVRQSARFQDRNTVVVLYSAYVRSILEYNAIIWSPHEKKYTLLLERVQRKFARYLYLKLYGYYPYMYPSLFVIGMVGLNTLELRRKLALLIHYYLLLNNRVDNPVALDKDIFDFLWTPLNLDKRGTSAAPVTVELSIIYIPS